MGYLYRLFGNTSSNVSSNGTKLLVITDDEQRDVVRLTKTNAALLKFEIRVIHPDSLQDNVESIEWAEALFIAVAQNQYAQLHFDGRIADKIVSCLESDVPISFIKAMYEQGAICVPLTADEPTELDLQQLLEKVYHLASV